MKQGTLGTEITFLCFHRQRKVCRGSRDVFFPIILRSSPPTRSTSFSSRLRAAPLLVYLYFMLDPIVQLKVVVLQRCGGAGGEPAVGACAVEEQPGAHCTQQDA